MFCFSESSGAVISEYCSSPQICEVIVQFKPNSEAVFHQQLTIVSSTNQTLNIKLIGRGLWPTLQIQTPTPHPRDTETEIYFNMGSALAGTLLQRPHPWPPPVRTAFPLFHGALLPSSIPLWCLLALPMCSCPNQCTPLFWSPHCYLCVTPTPRYVNLSDHGVKQFGCFILLWTTADETGRMNISDTHFTFLC